MNSAHNRRGRKGVLSFWLCGLMLLTVGCETIKVTRFYDEGVVVTVSPPAGEVGRQVFMDGGNAFDAAVATGFALAVTCPQAGNIGGGGFAVLREADSGRVEALDFRETAPAAATDSMFLGADGEAIDSLSKVGALASGVPGSVAGLYALWEKYGTLPWSDLVTPAARLADTGFVVDDHLASVFAEGESRLRRFDETRELFLPDGRPPRAGERFVQPELAATLYGIAAEGTSAFYEGAVADSVVATMERHGGIISLEDLSNYRAEWSEPLRFEFDSLEIYSMPPPSSGGFMVGQILGLLRPFDLSLFHPDSPEYIHLFCEASRLAFADRSEHLGDPAFWEVPSGLLNEEYLETRRKLISRHQAGNSTEIEPGHPTKYESENTTHYSVCDRYGNMVAVTTTLNSYFGSGLSVSGAGFLLNNEMDDFSVKPGHANLYGLVGGEANKIEPGKRMLSSMAPTVVLNDSLPFLILGSPGGSKIITTVAQGILNFTRFGLSLDSSVIQPRFHHQWLPDVVYLEAGGFDTIAMRRLAEYGHDVQERSPYGALEMIYIDPSGLMTGAADPRRGGTVAGLQSYDLR